MYEEELCFDSVHKDADIQSGVFFARSGREKEGATGRADGPSKPVGGPTRIRQ